ncbi:hypothetical protein BD626DRAFT_478261 [Schizophyllum amplum]|uniref:Fungal-type protein kinase domain-containing protein n=1 Tax=Schizophyllum amplum TaxID=97359 RepID=A0A550CR83_9AGAR|nr:hypothetical protein BD626DRAFT_478261 [Auriculariopsis ampla]
MRGAISMRGPAVSMRGAAVSMRGPAVSMRGPAVSMRAAVRHLYHHDLEALIWVFVWIMCCYNEGKRRRVTGHPSGGSGVDQCARP